MRYEAPWAPWVIPLGVGLLCPIPVGLLHPCPLSFLVRSRRRSKTYSRPALIPPPGRAPGRVGAGGLGLGLQPPPHCPQGGGGSGSLILGVPLTTSSPPPHPPRGPPAHTARVGGAQKFRPLRFVTAVEGATACPVCQFPTFVVEPTRGRTLDVRPWSSPSAGGTHPFLPSSCGPTPAP